METYADYSLISKSAAVNFVLRNEGRGCSDYREWSSNTLKGVKTDKLATRTRDFN